MHLQQSDDWAAAVRAGCSLSASPATRQHAMTSVDPSSTLFPGLTELRAPFPIRRHPITSSGWAADQTAPRARRRSITGAHGMLAEPTRFIGRGRNKGFVKVRSATGKLTSRWFQKHIFTKIYGRSFKKSVLFYSAYFVHWLRYCHRQ